MIARRRKRPRRHSVSYRTLHWLIRMEALYMLAAYQIPYVNEARARRQLWLDYRHRPERRAAQLLAHLPKRRVLG